MKYRHLVFLISILTLFFNPKYSVGQKGFFPGYIISNSGDTLTGKIKDRKSGTFVKLYKKIRFKPVKGFRKHYNPNDIQGYKIGNQKFITMDVNDEIVFFKHMVYGNPNSNNRQFIKVVSEGYLSWYQKEYVDESGLSSRSYFKRKDESEMVYVRIGLFGLNKKRLAAYFDDCPELADKILRKKIKTPEEILRFYNKFYKNK